MQDLLAHDGVRPVSCVVDQTLPDGGADSNPLDTFLGELHPLIRRLRACILRLLIVVNAKAIWVLFPSGGPPGSIRDITPRYDVQPVSPPVPNPNTTLGQIARR